MPVNSEEPNIHSNDRIDEMLHSAAELLEARHVVPEVGQKGAHMIRAAIADQRYRHVHKSPDTLAEQMTTDLRLATGDRHLYVEHIHDETTPEDDWVARWRREGPTQNWGVNTVRLLPGNVALLKITSFYTYELAIQALGAAMELVRHSDGLVLDLTDNGGGDDETADAVMETFLEDGAPRPLVIESRAGPETPKSPTDLRWPRYGAHRPLTIMINHRTFSAPEAVAYALQQEKRAIVVGSRSGGGANMIDAAVALPSNFKLGIPAHRPVSRATDSNWEGVGVQPDIGTSGDAALWRAWEIVRQRLGNADARPKAMTSVSPTAAES